MRKEEKTNVVIPKSKLCMHCCEWFLQPILMREMVHIVMLHVIIRCLLLSPASYSAWSRNPSLPLNIHYCHFVCLYYYLKSLLKFLQQLAYWKGLHIKLLLHKYDSLHSRQYSPFISSHMAAAGMIWSCMVLQLYRCRLGTWRQIKGRTLMSSCLASLHCM